MLAFFRKLVPLVVKRSNLLQTVDWLCADVEDERDIMVWDPRSQLSEEQMNEYLRGAEKRNALSDKTHEVLSFFNYNVEKSLGFCSDFVVAELFSDAEKTVVRHSVKIKHFRPLKSHNKFFTLKSCLVRLPQVLLSTIA
nr:unnamed protein product [Haemonchus contortus]